VTISPAVRAIIVEDEPLARQTLRALLAAVAWVECVGEAADGRAAESLIERTRPELIFLDVQLPGISGIDVLKRCSLDVVVIFATAYDDYALVAFELGAIDYVRKPFGRERVERALQRALPQIEAMRSRAVSNTAAGEARVALDRRLEEASSAQKRVEVIYARDRGTIVPIPIGDILRFEADGDFVAVFTHDRRYLICVTLADLTDRLDPARFLRVHRSHVVNLTAVAAVANIDSNRVELRMRDGARVVASRAGTRVLRGRYRNSS
jgi:two-component system LytT family response regulator